MGPDKWEEYLLELGWAVANGALPAGKFLTGAACAGVPPDALRLQAPEGHAGPTLPAVDLLWLLWNEVAHLDSSGAITRERAEEAGERLAELAKELLREKLVSREDLLSTAEVEMLVRVGLLTDPQSFQRKIVQINTKRIYAISQASREGCRGPGQGDGRAERRRPVRGRGPGSPEPPPAPPRSARSTTCCGRSRRATPS